MEEMKYIKQSDPDIFRIIQDEKVRQEAHIELIASENYTSQAVMEAQGSCLTNKYAEGYPGKRYYGGCEHIDEIETLAIKRAKVLFKADYANVQPHSGSQANAAAYMATMSPGDTLLGMSLSGGGHLTHGHPVNFSGVVYKAVQYGVNQETGLVDYEEVRRLAKTHQPKVIMAGFSAYSRVMDWAIFREIADEVGAFLIVDMAHVAGLVAANLYPSPVPFADVVTTTTHKTLRGPRGGLIVARANPELEKKLNAAVFPGLQGGPLEHVIAGKAIAFGEALQPTFVAYQQQVIDNAKAMAEVFQTRGYKIVSHGTDNHLFLVDLIGRELTGKKAEKVLSDIYLIVNKNSVPNDPRSPFVTSGLRLGTPAMTTRGMLVEEAKQIASWACNVLDDPDNEAQKGEIRQQVSALCKRFPVYRGRA